MKFRKIASALAVAGALTLGSSPATTMPASADDLPAPALSCALGIDGLVGFDITPVPDEEVQLFNFKPIDFIQEFEDGHLALPLENLRGVTSVFIYGVDSKRESAPIEIADCAQPTAIDVYITPGVHNHVNGRDWRTTCEKYSQTQRCRTEIWATQVELKNSKFVSTTGWTFNNLTYKPSPRAMWTHNPLGYTGSWTATDGRKWRTECDTAVTGRGGCRSYIWVNNVIESTEKPGGGYDYSLVSKWVMNNMVRFS